MAYKQGVSLTGVPGIAPAGQFALAAYWITTAEELVAASKAPGGTAALAAALGFPAAEVARWVAGAQAALPAGAELSYPTAEQEYPTGALEEPPYDLGESPAAAFDATSLPGTADWHDRLPIIRNQGGRSTCVAFASVAAREFLLPEGHPSDLSEQFLYWACKARDDYGGPGTYVGVAMKVLEDTGVCTEAGWPYSFAKVPGNEGQAPPPAGVETTAAGYRAAGYTPLGPRDVVAIKQVLAAGQLVVFAVPVYRYWSGDPIRVTGDVRMPLPQDDGRGGHAMLLAGYEDDLTVPGGGFFIVRNSWGEDWAFSSAIAPGYCRLPYAYIERYGNAAYALWPA
jgi:C1A family cysteine protease